MRVLMFAPYPYPNVPIHGGVESVSYNLIQGFKQLNTKIELHVLSMMHDVDETVNITPTITIQYLKRLHRSRKIELIKHIKPLLIKLNQEWNPDIIHIQGNGSNFLLYHKSYKHKLVYTQHGVLSQEIKYTDSSRRKLNYLVSLLIENFNAPKVKNWIFISRYNQTLNNKLVANGINFRCIYNPVNPIYIDAIKHNIDSGNGLLFVGSITPRKGLHDLLNALYRSNESDYHLHIVGGFSSADYENKIRNQVMQCGLEGKITFHGWKATEQIIEIANSCRYLVLPSHQETLPCVIAEAMAMGKVVIASLVGGTAEMVKDGETGFLYNPGNIEELTTILHKALHLTNLQYAAMSEKATNQADELYLPTKVAKQTLHFYQSIITHE